MIPEDPSNTASQPAALRDATDILARSASDEADAIEARERYRTEGLPAVDPDDEIRGRLLAGEGLVEVRPAALIGRAGGARGETADGAVSAGAPATTDSLSGRLYLTTMRLVLIARPGGDDATGVELSVGLADIEELALVGERLLVSLSDGTGLTIDAGRPRLLRVQIAAARSASRLSQVPEEEIVTAPGIGALSALSLEA